MKLQSNSPNIITVAVFVAFALVFGVLVFVAKSQTDPFAGRVLISIGSALFGSGLTFFLIQMTRSNQ